MSALTASDPHSPRPNPSVPREAAAQKAPRDERGGIHPCRSKRSEVPPKGPDITKNNHRYAGAAYHSLRRDPARIPGRPGRNREGSEMRDPDLLVP